MSEIKKGFKKVKRAEKELIAAALKHPKDRKKLEAQANKMLKKYLDLVRLVNGK